MRREPGFAARVARVVASIQRGRVATYGQVAALCGSPSAARQVGWVLRHTDPHFPWPKVSRSAAVRPRGKSWHRVVNREGRLSITHPHLTPSDQAALLKKEGVRVTKRAGAFWVDLKTYLWNPTDRLAGIV